MLNLSNYVVFNNVMCVATFISQYKFMDVRKESQFLATQYFFSQFWCKFTAQVMLEFFA